MGLALRFYPGIYVLLTTVGTPQSKRTSDNRQSFKCIDFISSGWKMLFNCNRFGSYGSSISAYLNVNRLISGY